jgi:hypothetical protein
LQRYVILILQLQTYGNPTKKVSEFASRAFLYCQKTVIKMIFEAKSTKNGCNYESYSRSGKEHRYVSYDSVSLKINQGGPDLWALTDRFCVHAFFSLLMFMFMRFKAREETGMFKKKDYALKIENNPNAKNKSQKN